jgi:hypothetical protein
MIDAGNVTLEPPKSGDLTADDLNKAERIANMSRGAMVGRIAKMYAKRRELEAEIKRLKAEAWQRCGWQSEIT